MVSHDPLLPQPEFRYLTVSDSDVASLSSRWRWENVDYIWKKEDNPLYDTDAPYVVKVSTIIFGRGSRGLTKPLQIKLQEATGNGENLAEITFSDQGLYSKDRPASTLTIIKPQLKESSDGVNACVICTTLFLYRLHHAGDFSSI